MVAWHDRPVRWPWQRRVGQDSAPDALTQRVIVTIALSDEFGTEAERSSVYELEDRLVAAIEASGVGELDGHGFGGGTAELFAYGEDASQLYTAMQPCLLEFAASAGAPQITVQVGDDGRTFGIDAT
jgi:hypothetical protein